MTAVSRLRRRLLNTVSGGAILAGALLAGEPQGLALSFQDTVFRTATGNYGSVVVKSNDGSQRFIGTPYDFLPYNSPSVKYCRGPSGLLRYGAHNLALQSERLSGASWVVQDVTVVVSQATPPPEIQNIFKIIPGNGITNGRISQTVNVVSGFAYQFDCFARADDADELSFVSNMITTFRRVTWNLTTGTVTSAGTGWTGLIEDLGSGWFRCKAQGIADQTGSVSIQIGNNSAYTGDGTKGVLVSGIGFRRLPSDDTYLKTTSSAVYELPYEWDTDGNLLGIRVEEQRTNLFSYSQDFSQWTSWSSDNFQLNYAEAPDGTMTATRFHPMFIEDPGASSRTLRVHTPINTSEGDVLTFSVFVKPINPVSHYIGNPDGPDGELPVYLALQADTSSGASFLNLRDLTVTADPDHIARVEPYANGWYRFSITHTASSADSSNQHFIIFSNRTALPNFDPYPSGDEDILFWGAQVEAGSFPTSYIQTAGSTVTRAADNISLATSKFSYNQNAGTLYASGIPLDASANRTIANICDSGTQGSVERFEVRIDSSSQLSAIIVSGGVASVSLNSGVVATGQLHKIALAATTSEATAYGNGSSLGTDTSVTMPSPAELRIGRQGSISPFFGHIQEIMYLPRRMSNTELQTLTGA